MCPNHWMMCKLSCSCFAESCRGLTEAQVYCKGLQASAIWLQFGASFIASSWAVQSQRYSRSCQPVTICVSNEGASDAAGAFDSLAAAAEGLQGRAAWLQLLQQLLQAPHLQEVLLAGLTPLQAEGSNGATDSSGSHGPGSRQAAGKAPSSSTVPGSEGTSKDDEAGEGEAARSAFLAFLARSSWTWIL